MFWKTKFEFFLLKKFLLVLFEFEILNPKFTEWDNGFDISVFGLLKIIGEIFCLFIPLLKLMKFSFFILIVLLSFI